MGKTYKDRKNWDKKPSEQEPRLDLTHQKRLTKKRLKERLPDSEEPDPYEAWERED